MVTKIITGGQTGADQAGLHAAKEWGLQTGGHMPKDFLTEEGDRPDFESIYGMEEHSSSKYTPRTKLNVQNSDGTIIFDQHLNGELSRGTKLAMKECSSAGKPFLLINTNNRREAILDSVSTFLSVARHKTVNIAGNRESKAQGMEEFVFGILTEAFPITVEKVTTRKMIDGSPHYGKIMTAAKYAEIRKEKDEEKAKPPEKTGMNRLVM